MTSAVGFNPLSYIQNIVAATKPASASSTSSTGATDGDGDADGSTSTTGGTSSTASALGLSSSLLSLLQGTDSTTNSTGNVISSLLGDSNTTGVVSSADPLAGLYNSLYTQASQTQPFQAALSSAENQQSQSSTGTDTTNTPVQNLVSNLVTASNAYNQTLLQTAQQVAAANNYGANGAQLIA